MSRLAALLRRLADRIDPPRPPAPEGEMRMVSRDELREIQGRGMQMIDDFIHLSRSAGRDDGLLWVPTDVLASVTWLIEVELEVRHRDYERIERDPRTVLR